MEQGYPLRILSVMGFNSPGKQPRLRSWKALAAQVDQFQAQDSGVHIAIIGKYTGLPDAYLSVIKGLQHSSHFIGRKLFIDWIEASDLEDATKKDDAPTYEKAWNTLKSVNGILVPGGFGLRGVEGKILACKYARENKVPYFGICYGLQIAVVEYARNVLGWSKAHSEEWVGDTAVDQDSIPPDTPERVVVFMPEISKTTMGGNMRLGARQTIFTDKECLTSKLYEKVLNKQHNGSISERHRHRYEVNPQVVKEIAAAGLSFVGHDDTGLRQEIIEIKGHPFFVAVQYHPEMKSRPMKPSPLFAGFMLAAAGYLDGFLKGEWKREATPFDNEHD